MYSRCSESVISTRSVWQRRRCRKEADGSGLQAVSWSLSSSAIPQCARLVPLCFCNVGNQGWDARLKWTENCWHFRMFVATPSPNIYPMICC